MRILGHVAFLLLLGGIWCQNNRNAKTSGRSTKKSGGNQGVDVGQSPPVVGLTAGSTGRGTGGSAEAGREGAAGARAAGQQTDDMRLHFLKNTQVTCNDGTAAGWDVQDLVFSLTCFPGKNLAGNLTVVSVCWLIEWFQKLHKALVCPYMAAVFSSPSSHSCLFAVLQVLPKGVQRKPPMAVISGRWVFKNSTG